MFKKKIIIIAMSVAVLFTSDVASAASVQSIPKDSTNLNIIKNKNSSIKKNSIKMSIPKKQNNFKSWMSYSVFGKKTAQGKLQKKAKTGKYGIRQVDGRLCIAVGTYYSKKVGEKLDITLKNGKKIKCIVGDIKADKDTNKTKQYCKHNGSIVEFIVNTNKMPKSVKRSGSYSSVKDLSGKITKIEKIKD